MSPKRNRVTPLGDIVAIPLRGAWTGNRGILHSGFEIKRYHASNLWITCALEFRGWWREQWLPNRWTHLFFHDEAVSFAAGHRPCAECRRGDYDRYRVAWARGLSVETPLATEINRQLHGERIVRGSHRRRLHTASWASLPNAAFVLVDDGPAVVADDHIAPWTEQGYGSPQARPRRGDATVITPPATLAAFRAGYEAQIDVQAR